MNLDTFVRLKDVLDPIRDLARDQSAPAVVRIAAGNVIRAITGDRELTLRELAAVALDPGQPDARRVLALQRIADQIR